MPESTALKNKPASVIPESVKQIGSIENDLRIYMEDYVYTYINQYARHGIAKEKLGILVGNHYLCEGKNILIINGFIKANASNNERGSATFTKESWKNIKEAHDKYFKGTDIVGWVHTQPGFGAFLMAKDESYHNELFPNDHQVLFVMDPSEKIDTFYIRNTESDRLSSAKGYFIYYDQNDPMQDYMEENRIVRKKEPRFVPDEEKEEKPKLLSFLKPKNDTPQNFGDPASVSRNRLKKRSASESQKRKFGILGSVSAILCASCIMICLNVMNHSERIRNIESELNNNHILSSQETAAVFAPQDEENITVTENEVSVPSSPDETDTDIYTSSIPETVTERDIPEYYIVEKGDSLSYISRKFYGDDSMITAIMAENDIENSDRIFYGKKLILP